LTVFELPPKGELAMKVNRSVRGLVRSEHLLAAGGGVMWGGSRQSIISQPVRIGSHPRKRDVGVPSGFGDPPHRRN
jgi:hypothetical protein